MKKDIEDTAPKKKFMNNKEKRKNLSRMQRKVCVSCSHRFQVWCLENMEPKPHKHHSCCGHLSMTGADIFSHRMGIKSKNLSHNLKQDRKKKSVDSIFPLYTLVCIHEYRVCPSTSGPWDLILIKK